MAILYHHLEDENWIHTELVSAVILERDTRCSVIKLACLDHFGDSGRAFSCDTVLLYPAAQVRRGAAWALLAPGGYPVRVNGAPLESGIHVLADRDSIRVDDLPALYFSTERLARVEAFAGEEAVCCPRCKLKINKGDAAVCCPGCNVWHHEAAQQDRNCWSYSRNCALCDQPTEIESAAFRWSPEDL